MSNFYGVAHGFARGVYTDWNEAKKQIDDFPQAVHKKFGTREEAQKFVDDRKPKQVSLTHPEANQDTYYAVARGYSVGVFTNYDDVKKSIDGYPQPLQKKFTNLDDAVAHFQKFYEGKTEAAVTESGRPKRAAAEKSKKDAEKAPTFYAVARGKTPGVYLTWAECQEQTKDFKGAKFKKFDDESDAELFAQGKTLKQIEEGGGKKGAGSGYKKRKVDVEAESVPTSSKRTKKP